jgi:hypothetical protein
MVVTNRNRITAIVIRHDGAQVTLVPMRAGRLSACRLPHEAFLANWKETPYSLSNALARFQRHVREHGASQEVVKGLKRLEMRDRWVVANLF